MECQRQIDAAVERVAGLGQPMPSSLGKEIQWQLVSGRWVKERDTAQTWQCIHHFDQGIYAVHRHVPHTFPQRSGGVVCDAARLPADRSAVTVRQHSRGSYTSQGKREVVTPVRTNWLFEDGCKGLRTRAAPRECDALKRPEARSDATQISCLHGGASHEHVDARRVGVPWRGSALIGIGVRVDNE